MAGFIPTSLQDIHIELNDDDVSIFHLTWFLDDLEKLYHLVQVTIHDDYPCAHFFSEPGNHTLSFIFSLKGYSDLIMQMSSALSAKLSAVEELFIFVNDNCTYRSLRDHNVLLPSFLQHFRSVKVLRVKHYDVPNLANTLQPDGEPILDVLPMLEEINIRTSDVSERQLAAFHPFIAARQEAGRPVKLSASP